MGWYGHDYGERWGGGYGRGRGGSVGGGRGDFRPGGGFRGRGFAGGYDMGYRGRERTRFAAGRGYGGYDRDMGDQLREGWQDLKRGVRRAFGGGGYDRGYRGGDFGGGRGFSGPRNFNRGYDERWW